MSWNLDQPPGATQTTERVRGGRLGGVEEAGSNPSPAGPASSALGSTLDALQLAVDAFVDAVRLVESTLRFHASVPPGARTPGRDATTP